MDKIKFDGVNTEKNGFSHRILKLFTNDNYNCENGSYIWAGSQKQENYNIYIVTVGTMTVLFKQQTIRDVDCVKY